MSVLKIFAGSLLSLIIAFVVFLCVATINDYQPDDKKLITTNKAERIKKDTLEAVIWNIGYAGLGSDMDFFYDGGNKMRTTRQKTNRNLEAILVNLNKYRNFDFILLQEVDINSKRSWHINQKKLIKRQQPQKYWDFAFNYKVGFVPMPVGNPLGKVQSGLLTGSNNRPTKVVRHQFKANYSWPTSVFMLDRCFLASSFPLKNGDTLYIVNTHNTAYDEGNIRLQQMKQLKNWLQNKYNDHTHIIVGGDWNQMPPDIDVDFFGVKPKSKNYRPVKVPPNFLPEGWRFVYDTTSPTNRGLDTIYHKRSFKTIIDYYLVSPNIDIITVKTHDLNFKITDHHPVFLKFKLN